MGHHRDATWVIIKRIVASYGDPLCRDSTWVIINRIVASYGVPLCRRLLWVVIKRIVASYGVPFSRHYMGLSNEQQRLLVSHLIDDPCHYQSNSSVYGVPLCRDSTWVIIKRQRLMVSHYVETRHGSLSNEQQRLMVSHYVELLDMSVIIKRIVASYGVPLCRDSTWVIINNSSVLWCPIMQRLDMGHYQPNRASYGVPL